MKLMRRILGILVMIAGILGLLISVAGLVGVWMAKPTVLGYLTLTIDTLSSTIGTSQEAMEVTRQALHATVESVDALSVMLASTADSVEDTGPVIEEVHVMMRDKLPATLNSATDSLKSAQQAAAVMDSSVRSLQSFQTAMGSVPLISSFVETPTQAYDPEKPLAASLGEVAANLDTLPGTFINIADGIDKADDNFDTIQTSLTTMSTSVKQISQSLSQYETMVTESKSSVQNLAPMLTQIQTNLATVVNGVVWALTLFFVWLLVIQVVVFTQGFELYQGTAGRMEGGPESGLESGSENVPAPQPAV